MPDSPPPPAAARIRNRGASGHAMKDNAKVSANQEAADASGLLILLLRCPREGALAALESVLAIPRVELVRLVQTRTGGSSRRRARGQQALDFCAILRGGSLAQRPAAVRAAVLPTRGAPAPRCVRAHVLPLRATAV